MKKQFIFYSQLGARKRAYQGSKFSKYKGKNGKHPTLTKEWLSYRLKVWQYTALPSILNQTIDDFQYWIIVDPRNDELFDQLYGFENLDPRVKLIHSKDSSTPEMMEEINDYTNHSADQHYIIRLASDDYCHPDTLKIINETKINKPFYRFKFGYMFDLKSKQMRYYNSDATPCYCHIYDKSMPHIIFNSKNEKIKVSTFPTKYTWFEPGHNKVKTYPHILGPSGKYIVTTHDKNSSGATNLKNPDCKPLKNKNIKDIIQDFNAQTLMDF